MNADDFEPCVSCIGTPGWRTPWNARGRIPCPACNGTGKQGIPVIDESGNETSLVAYPKRKRAKLEVIK